jgi:pantoate--beta-alanine ligase
MPGWPSGPPSMVVCPDPASARAWCERVRATGRTIGFVPTMGALHEGHLGLVRRAAAENDAACVSIFVNPLQFDDPGDFARYPRDLEADQRLLTRAGAAMVFSGRLSEFFPAAAGSEAARHAVALRDPGPAARGLEGEHRPGHFAGVATIVERLFDVVRPRRAYFGEKDFQQTLVVRALARELGYPEVVVCTTSRDPDGLARSSRNAFLSGEARALALGLSRALFAARDAWRRGERDARRLRDGLRRMLEVPGIELEYAEIRDDGRFELEPAEATRGELREPRALVAARVGGVRLIDNLSLLDPDDFTGGEARGSEAGAPGEPGAPRV